MNVLKSILLAGGATVIMAAAAHAADLPTKKAAPAPVAVDCYASFMTWLDSTAADCPLKVGPLTLYGQIDVGAGYETNGAPFNKYYPSGVSELVSKQNNGGKWQFVPNGLSQSNVGVKLKQGIVGDVALIGDVNFGFDPYSLNFANGPASLQSNNNVPAFYQSANGDSSRAGTLINSRAYLGLSSPTYGTLTAGRQNSIENNLQTSYDPMGAAYGFGMVGGSTTLTAGTGDTETARYNTSVEYIYDYNKVAHIGGIYQIGGYDQGNGSEGAYQLNIGGSFAGFSLDGVYAYDKDAVQLSSLGGNSGKYGLPAGMSSNDLKATLADISAFTLLAKYQWQQLTFFGAYQHATLSNPSDTFTGGLNNTLGGYQVPFKNISSTSYTINKVLQTAWVGAKYGITSQLDITGAYYEAWQNNYSGKACVANTVGVSGAPKGTAPQGTNTVGNNTGDPKKGTKPSAVGNCDGTEPAVGLLLDYRPFKRVDTYLGVLYSSVSGGMATGFIQTNNVAVTGGVRVSF